MKKLVFILLMLLLVSCDQDALNYYIESGEKTDTIDRAKSSLELNLEMDFSEDMITSNPSIVDLLSYVTYRSESKFDRSSHEKMTYQYLGSEGFGIDTSYYEYDQGTFLKVPFVGKFLNLNEMDTIQETDFSAYDRSPLTDEMLAYIKDEWMALVQEEDVVNLGNEIIDTPEGEVKVKKFVVTLSHEQIQSFLTQIIEKLRSDAYFIEVFESYPLYTLEDDQLVPFDAFEMDVQMFLDNMSDLLDDIIISNFKMTTYIDIDQYIIESNYDISLNFVGDLETVIEALDLKVNYLLYDLHEKIEFDFPSITENQLTTFDEVLEIFEESIPEED